MSEEYLEGGVQAAFSQLGLCGEIGPIDTALLNYNDSQGLSKRKMNDCAGT